MRLYVRTCLDVVIVSKNIFQCELQESKRRIALGGCRGQGAFCRRQVHITVCHVRADVHLQVHYVRMRAQYMVECMHTICPNVKAIAHCSQLVAMDKIICAKRIITYQTTHAAHFEADSHFRLARKFPCVPDSMAVVTRKASARGMTCERKGERMCE